ncbi:MAG: hypothetical protein R3E32_28915 [Chitinophagales bacterium]
MTIEPITLQWATLIGFGALFFWIAPYSKTVEEFFAARSDEGKQPGIFMLTSSLVISWIFAKSITNAANLGLEFGIVGGVAYAVYYFSFVVGGLVIYQLRTKGGFKSIHHFLESRFGREAVMVFSLLIGFRLFNEVWSNTMVVGTYFGVAGSGGYYAAILVVTALTLAYTMKGGLRSSLLTDAIQMVFFGVLLLLLLGFILPHESSGVGDFLASGTWSMGMGVNLFLAALLQTFSYPFHDPVLTDRGFISTPKMTLKSYLLAAVIGFFCIVLFSFVGIFAQMQGLKGQAAVEVGKLLGTAAMLAMNFIMITSAASTLDSTFSSFSKLMVMDLGQKKLRTVSRGRLMMVVLVILGTLPVFMNPEILSATTVSGTMVMGLAPVFLLWNMRASKLSFHFSIGFGVLVGIVLAMGAFPDALVFSEGRYAELLWANVWGLMGCFGLFIGFAAYVKER